MNFLSQYNNHSYILIVVFQNYLVYFYIKNDIAKIIDELIAIYINSIVFSRFFSILLFKITSLIKQFAIISYLY